MLEIARHVAGRKKAAMDEPLELPEQQILRAHAEGLEILKKAQLDWVSEPPETPEVALAVEGHRWHWKPKKISCVLIAESHVYTSSSDLKIRVDNDIVNEHLPPDLRNAPIEFVRLVYCLGYGNTSLLTQRPETRNSGTPQFWKLFGDLAEGDPYPTGVNWRDRLAWQKVTLQTLSRKGIWLLDSSLHAIYVRGGERVNNDIKYDLHRIWWNCYGKWLLEQVKSTKAWAIGTGVHSTLTSLGAKLDGYIYQPNARNIRPEKRDQQLKDLITACRRAEEEKQPKN